MPHDPTAPPLRWWSTRLWGAHALLLLVVAVTVGMGWWQWTVSEGHKSDKSDALAHATPVPLSKVMGNNDAFPGDETGRPTLLEGIWVPSGTVYVSGHQGGYWVATPLAIGTNPDAPAMYVVRGWVSSPAKAPAAPTGPARLVGWVQPPEAGGLSDDDPKDDVLPELAISDAMGHVRQDLYSGYAIVADAEPGWPPADAARNDGSTGLAPAHANAMPQASFTTGLRNLLYALEWWVFGLLAVYVWWRYVRDALSPAEDAPRDGDGDGDGDGAHDGGAPGGDAEKSAQQDAVPFGS